MRLPIGAGDMSVVEAYLFGQFRIRCGDDCWQGPEGCKSKELLSYLLIHSSARYNREQLISVLWGDAATLQSRKSLRQVLWQLQSACETSLKEADGNLLLISQDWIQINPEIELWT